MNSERAEKNFKFWKTLVNLPASFPKLKELPMEELGDLTVISPEHERLIMNSIFTKPLTQVVVDDGCGLSSLYRYIMEKCRAISFDRTFIPVPIDLEKDKSELSREFLEQTIKKQVLGNLIEKPWHTVLAEEFYYYCINFQEERDFNLYRAEVLDFLYGKKAKAWSSLERTFPFIKEPLDEFLNYLLTKMRIQTILFFHIPRLGMDEEQLLSLVSALKMIYEDYTIESAAIREVYFINRTFQADLNREFKRDYNVVLHPKPTGAEIFAMMNKRFRPSLPAPEGRKDRIDLGAVFSEDFIHLAQPEEKSIAEVIAAVGEMILEKMDCDRKDIPYKLTLSAEQKKKLSEAAARETETEEPKKIIFTRKRR